MVYLEGNFVHKGGRKAADELAYNAKSWFPDNVAGFTRWQSGRISWLDVVDAAISGQECLEQIAARTGFQLTEMETYLGALPANYVTMLLAAQIRHLGVVVGEEVFVFQTVEQYQQNALLVAQRDEILSRWLTTLETLKQRRGEALQKLGLDEPKIGYVLPGAPIENLIEWIVREAGGDLEQAELAEYAVRSLEQTTDLRKRVKVARAMFRELRTNSNLLLQASYLSSQ